MGKKKHEEWVKREAKIYARHKRVIDDLNEKFKSARSEFRAEYHHGTIRVGTKSAWKFVDLQMDRALPGINDPIDLGIVFSRMKKGAWNATRPTASRDCYKTRYFPKNHWGTYGARVQGGVLIVGDEMTEIRHPISELGPATSSYGKLSPSLKEVKVRVDKLLKENPGLKVEGGLTSKAVFSKKMPSLDNKELVVSVECDGMLTDEIAAGIMPALEAEHKAMIQRVYDKVNAGLEQGARRWGELIIRDLIEVLPLYNGVSESALTAILRGTALPTKVFKHSSIKHNYLSDDQVKHMIHTLSRSGAITFRTVNGNWNSYPAYTFHLDPEMLDYCRENGDIAFSTQVLDLIQRWDLQLGDYMTLVEALHRPAVMAGYGDQILAAFDTAPETLLPLLKVKLDLCQDKAVTKHIKAAIGRVKKR